MSKCELTVCFLLTPFIVAALILSGLYLIAEASIMSDIERISKGDTVALIIFTSVISTILMIVFVMLLAYNQII